MRIGVFGGTFDPPHEGHVEMAVRAAEQLRLDHIEVVPSHTPPHRGRPLADSYHRFAMVVIATLGSEKLLPSAREIRRAGVSYTVDTLRGVADEMPDAELFLLIGGDSYDDLDNWREPREIRRLAHLAVVSRDGSGAATGAPAVKGARSIVPVVCRPLPFSARQIRAELAAGNRDIVGLPAAVDAYIRRAGLYGTQGKEQASHAQL